MVSQYDNQNSPSSSCTIIIVRDFIVKLAVILGPIIISTNVCQNFGVNVCSVQHLLTLLYG